MSSRKRWIIVALVAVLVVLLFFSFRPQPAAVSTAQVTRGPLQVTIEQEGRTRVHDRYVVTAPVAGYAPRLTLEVGDKVEVGEVLLMLRPTPPAPLDPRTRAQAEARVEQTRATLQAEQSRLNAAQSSNDLARREYERLKALFQRGDISRSMLDQAQAEAEQAEANLRAARAAVAAGRQELRVAQAAAESYASEEPEAGEQSVPILAPVSGEVLAIHRKSRGVVALGEPLLNLGDPSALEVEIDVLSSDAVRIRPGMRVLFDRWGGEPRLEGRVRTVEPSAFTKISALGVEEQRVWVIVDFTSPRSLWERLGDGYRVEANFVLWEEEAVLKVPSSALFQIGEQWAVFVVEGGRAVRRPVRLGRQGTLESQVLEGLSAGQQVILHPNDSIDDGTRVEPR